MKVDARLARFKLRVWHRQRWVPSARDADSWPETRDEAEMQLMKYGQHPRGSQYLPQYLISATSSAFLIGAILFLMAGVAGAQTNAPQAALVQRAASAPGKAQDQGKTTRVKPARATPTPRAVVTASAAVVAPAATNATAVLAEARIEVAPRARFLADVPELSVEEPKANELTLGEHTVSGIIVQFFKTGRPLQLFNPAAASQYGSGWDNVEVFPASVSGPALKLFSLGL